MQERELIHKRIFFLVLFVVCLFSSGFSITLNNNGDVGYETVVNVPEFKVSDADFGYVDLKMGGGYITSGELGTAAIPQKVFRIAIGKNMIAPEISTEILEKETLSLSKKLYPVQQDWPCCTPLFERPFSFDADYYRNQGKRNSLVSVSKPFICHGVPGVMIKIKPFFYNPAKNTLEVIKKFKLKIKIQEGISSIPAISSKAGHAYLKCFYKNYNVPLKHSNRNNGDENYLMIVAPEFENCTVIDSFVNFRKEKYNVKKVTVSEAGGSSDAIKTYLQNMYNTDGLTYVLFVGNKGNLPYFSSGPASFWQYGLIDGNDNYTDIFVGIFCVRSEESLENIVHKTIHTEYNISDYPDTTSLYCTFLDDAGQMAGQHKFFRDRYWLPGGWKASFFCPTPESPTDYTSDLITQINNNNTRFVAYQGHGSSTGWAGDYGRVNQSDVRNLTNTEVYPFVWGYACSNGTFQNSSECFAETWIGAEHGAVMFTGASAISASYQKALNAGMACGASLKKELTTIGQIFSFGKTYVFDSTDDIADELNFVGPVDSVDGSKMYNLFGDPALLIREASTGISFKEDYDKKHKLMSLNFISNNRISINILERGKYNVSLFSTDGKKIYNIRKNTLFTKGENIITWNRNLFAKGMYLLNVKGMSREFSEKVIFLR